MTVSDSWSDGATAAPWRSALPAQQHSSLTPLHFLPHIRLRPLAHYLHSTLRYPAAAGTRIVAQIVGTSRSQCCGLHALSIRFVAAAIVH